MLNCDYQLTINLAAIQNNWLLLKNSLRSGAECAAVVKANAYGLGANEVATALFEHGCRTFFVANLQEALALQAVVSTQTRVIIFGGLRPGEELPCLQKSFVPVLSTIKQIERWVEAGSNFKQPYAAAIKVDTGMHRLGLLPEQLTELCQQRELLLACHPILLLTHMACAELPEHPLNAQQLSVFKQAAAQIKAVIPEIKLSLANSSAIFLGEDFHADLVRPGASLYGVNPTPHLQNPMSPVVSLALPIVQIKTIVGPASVGYGATFEIPVGKKVKLALALGGYADGIFRYLSNRGCGLIAGQQVPLVGRVSMDMVMFDVSDINNTLLEESDVITLIGDTITVDDIARDAGTIGYEVLTALGSRYRRRYVFGK